MKKKQKAFTFNKIFLYSKKLQYNIKYLKKISQTKDKKFLEPFVVIKANAYGHGILEVAQIIEKLPQKDKPKYLAVDSFFEALKIQKVSKIPILLISPNHPQNIKYIFDKKITLSVGNFSDLKEAVKYKKKAKIHLAFNTGMNREGFVKKDIDKVLQILSKNKKINVEGIYSHFTDADNFKNHFTQKQEKKFSEILDIVLPKLSSQKVFPKWIHLGNSARFLKTTDTRINSFRPGIALYGINPLSPKDKHFQELEKLKPFLRLESTITDIQDLKKGQSVSYGSIFKAKKDMMAGVVPLGYYEGINRKLSNSNVSKNGFFKAKSDQKFLQILGKVCMNLTVIDITKTKLKTGSKIIAISEKKEDMNSIKNIAKNTKTIPYEILTAISNTHRREIL